MRSIVPDKVNKILIICLNGIGDVITTTPLILSIRKAYPKAKLFLLVKNKFMESVFGNSAIVDEFIHFDPRNMSISRSLKLIQVLASKKFDLSFTATDTDLSKGPLLAFFAGIKHRVGEVKGTGLSAGFGILYNYPVQLNYRQHRVESNLDLFRRISSKEVVSELFFSIEDSHEEGKAAFLNNIFKTDAQSYICIHPGCNISESWRRWPIKRYIFVAEEITKHYKIPVIFIGGKDELSLSFFIRKRTNPLIINGINKLRIGSTAALIRDAELLIGNDSGLMHIAGAVKTPTVSLIAYNLPKRCAPWGSDNEVVEPPKTVKGKYRIKGISVQKVLEAVDSVIIRNQIFT